MVTSFKFLSSDPVWTLGIGAEQEMGNSNSKKNSGSSNNARISASERKFGKTKRLGSVFTSVGRLVRVW